MVALSLFLFVPMSIKISFPFTKMTLKGYLMKQESKGKKCLTKKEQADYWQEKYLEAKINGDKNKMKIYESIILKLGFKPTKL